MRRGVLCVPMMMTALLLTGCGGGKLSETEQMAYDLRDRYAEVTQYSTSVSLTADYGSTVFRCEMDVTAEGGQTALTLTAPDSLSGMTVHLREGESQLEYEELMLDTGPLDENGLTPVNAVPILVETAGTGLVTATSMTDDGLLRVEYGEPDVEPGEGRSVSLWVEPDSGALVRGEISSDGTRVITCEFTDFIVG